MQEKKVVKSPVNFPTWLVFGSLIIVAVAVVCIFAGPLNTSPDQEIPAKYQTK